MRVFTSKNPDRRIREFLVVRTLNLFSQGLCLLARFQHWQSVAVEFNTVVRLFVPKKNTITKVGYDIVSFSECSAPTSLERLLTVQEVAELLRVSVSSLNKWRLLGRGPAFVYVGQRVRYQHGAVAAYIAERTRTSTSATCAPEEAPAA